MFLLHGEAKYMDILEKTLYNGLISGIGLDGKSFFYTNALQVKGHGNPDGLEVERSGWFECSCCPTNLVRLIPSIPGYIYAQQDNKLFINLFISGNASLNIGHTPVQIIQQNNYPWEGALSFTIQPQKPVDGNILIRIPGWARNQAIPSDLYRFQGSEGSD